MNSIDTSPVLKKEEGSSTTSNECPNNNAETTITPPSSLDSESDSSQIVANGKRTGKRWSTKEDQNLRMLVKKHGSCKWKEIAVEFSSLPGMPTRSDVQCLHRWNKCLQPGLIKGSWTREEDEIIIAKYAKERPNMVRWCVIADSLPGRLGKQVRERWINHLDPSLVKRGWTPEEDELLYNLRKQHGNRWKMISKQIPGRSENGVKNRWHSIKPNLAKRMAQWARHKEKRARAAAAAISNSTPPQVPQMQLVLASTGVPTDQRLSPATTANPCNMTTNIGGQNQHVYQVTAPNMCPSQQPAHNQQLHTNSMIPHNQGNNHHVVIQSIPVHHPVNPCQQVMAVSSGCQGNPPHQRTQIARRDSHSSYASAMSGHSMNLATGQPPAAVISSHPVQSQPNNTMSYPSTYVIPHQQPGNVIFDKSQYATPIVIQQSPQYSTMTPQHGVLLAANPPIQQQNHHAPAIQMLIVPQVAAAAAVNNLVTPANYWNVAPQSHHLAPNKEITS